MIFDVPVPEIKKLVVRVFAIEHTDVTQCQ